MFILSKIVSFFLNPFLWVLILLLWAIFTKNPRRKKIISAVCLVVFLVFSSPWIVALAFQSLQAKKVELKSTDKYSAGILLGGFVSHDNSTNESYFNQTADRFIQTAMLYKKGHIQKIIISGGNGIGAKGDFVEAKFAADNLEALGIPPSDIIQESRSRNTRENALYCKEIVDSLHLSPPYLLVTSAFHVPRASKTFAKAGLQTSPYPCAFLVLPSETTFRIDKLIPSAYAFNLWPIYLKELVGSLTN